MSEANPTANLGPVLVTGATGQLGQRLVYTLLAQGTPVTILTRSLERAERLWPDKAVRIYRGDLTDPSTLHGLGSGIQTVFHLASHHPGPHEPDLYNAPDHWQVSAQGTANLLAALAEAPMERLVYVSSVRADPGRPQTAGSGSRLSQGDATPPVSTLSTTSTTLPPCLYGRAKLAAEQQVLVFGAQRTIKASVLRLPMVYGLDGAGNLERLVRAIAVGRFPPWPRIAQQRSAIHVEDAIACMLLLARHPATGGQVYVATDGYSYSTRWIYERTLAGLGRPIPSWTMPLWALRLAAAGGTFAERLLSRRLPLTLDALAKLTEDAWYDGTALKDLGFVARHDLASEIDRLLQRLGSASAPSPGQPRAQ